MLKQLSMILEGKFKKETAAEIFARYESLKKSHAEPELLAKVLAQANDQMDFEMKAKMKNLDAKYAGEDWWETVKTFYKIEERNNEWAIISDAKDWKEQKEWVYPTKYEAEEQLFKLIGYKIHDRKAGHGSEDKDFERADMLAKRRGVKESEASEEKAERYADDLAKRLPKNLESEKDILDAGFKQAEKDIGRKSAIYYFQYDEDFPGDLVSAYIEENPLGELGSQKQESYGRRTMGKFLAQEGVFDAVKKGVKSVKRGMQGWGGVQAKPAELVKRNKEWDDEKLAKLDLRNKVSNYDDTVGKHSPRGLQDKVIDREMKKRGLTKEAKDDRYWTSSAKDFNEVIKKRYGEVTRKNDEHGRWAYFNKAGDQVALSDIDGEGDRTYSIFQTKAVKEDALNEWSLTYDDNWKDKIEPEQLEAELIKYLNKKFGGKAIFKGDSESYLMDTSKPKVLVATGDGSIVKVKRLIDVEKYVDKNDFADFAMANVRDWADYFKAAKKDVKESLMSEMIKMIPRGRLNEGFSDTDSVFLTPATGPLAAMRYNTFKEGSTAEHKKAIKYHEQDADRATPAKAKFHDMRAKMHKDWLEKNPHSSKLGQSLDKALSKEKKASPVQVEKNKERWAKIKGIKEAVDMEAVRAMSDAGLKKMIKDFESQVRMGSLDAKAGLKALKDEDKRRSSAGYVEEAVGGRIDKMVRNALANGTKVFYKDVKNSKKSGYVTSEVDGKFQVTGSGRTKSLVTFDDAEQKASKDADRLYIQDKSEWNASKEIKEAVETFKGYDVHHNPDSVMVLVLGSDEGAQDDYYGINVVFKKPGTKPELVTGDDLADRQVAKYKAQIIAAAEKRLGKEEKEHLASL